VPVAATYCAACIAMMRLRSGPVSDLKAKAEASLRCAPALHKMRDWSAPAERSVAGALAFSRRTFALNVQNSLLVVQEFGRVTH